MQLVGATKSFIRKPFLSYGILHGLLGGLIAIILLLITLYVAQQQVPEMIILRDWFEFSMVFIGVIILGVLISGLSTYFAVSKFLHLKIYDLYK
jgi:cell division transport system permease protein